MNWLQILNNTFAQILAPATLGYALAAIGLSVHFGFAGLLNMGVAGFMAIGAYGFAVSILTFGLPWPVAVLIGLIGAVLFAIILGIPTLRLRGDYLAIVTIAAAEVLRLLFLTSSNRAWSGSADGLSGFQRDFRASNPLPPGRWGFGPWTYQSDQWWVIIVGTITIAIAVLIVWLLMRSPWGRVIRGIREDEDAVRSLGKNVFKLKLQAFVLGSVIGGIAGIIFMFDGGFVSRTSSSRRPRSTGTWSSSWAASPPFWALRSGRSSTGSSSRSSTACSPR